MYTPKSAWSRRIARLLKEEHGMSTIETLTSVPGPGNAVAVYWTLGDCHVACISHDLKVLWKVTAGGTMEGGNSVLIPPYEGD